MRTNWRESAHSGEGSALCIWVLHGLSDVCIDHAAFGDVASAEVRAFILLALCEEDGAVVKEVSLCFIQDVQPPTYHQSVMSMRSYIETSALLQHLGVAWRCGTSIWRLHDRIIHTIWCLRPHFQIKHKLSFWPGLRNALIH